MLQFIFPRCVDLGVGQKVMCMKQEANDVTLPHLFLAISYCVDG